MRSPNATKFFRTEDASNQARQPLISSMATRYVRAETTCTFSRIERRDQAIMWKALRVRVW
jgi:hypothetical protein